MYFAVSSHFQSIAFITILLAVVSHALPLESRAKNPTGDQDNLACNDKHKGPCACYGQVRLTPTKPVPLKYCGSHAYSSIALKNPQDPPDPTKPPVDVYMVGLVSLSYSKEFMSPNPHDLE